MSGLPSCSGSTSPSIISNSSVGTASPIDYGHEASFVHPVQHQQYMTPTPSGYAGRMSDYGKRRDNRDTRGGAPRSGTSTPRSRRDHENRRGGGGGNRDSRVRHGGYSSEEDQNYGGYTTGSGQSSSHSTGGRNTPSNGTVGTAAVDSIGRAARKWR